MNILDHLIALVLVVGLPLYATLSWPAAIARVRANEPGARTGMYWATCRMQWVPTAALLIGWWLVARPWSELGFAIEFTTRFWIVLSIAVAVGAGIALQYIGGLRSAESRRRTSASFGEAADFAPHTRRELRPFTVLAITAGVCEEILYRGFLIWYLTRFTGETALGLTAAVALSSIVFGAGHLYQGPKAAARIAGLAVVMGALFVVSGSLWIVMALHVFVDMAGGLLAVALFRDDDAAGTVNDAGGGVAHGDC